MSNPIKKTINDGLPELADYLGYRKNVGVEALHVTGLPGTGKTNMTLGLLRPCLRRGEQLIIPGDRFCEWRHYLRWMKKDCSYGLKHFKPDIDEIKVLVPKDMKIHYHGKSFTENYRRQFFKRVDYINDLNQVVKEYLPEDNKVRILVIYDAHLVPPARTALWVHILDQLLLRTTHLETAISLLFNEAGIYFPESAQGDQWKAVSAFSEKVVDCRKGLVRLILISQLVTEVESTIRKKCMWKIYKKGGVEGTMPKGVKYSVPYIPLHGFDMQRGGLYRTGNRVSKFKELNEIWKMVPHGYIDSVPSLYNTANKKIQTVIICGNCSHNWKPRVSNPARCPSCGSRLGKKRK